MKSKISFLTMTSSLLVLVFFLTSTTFSEIDIPETYPGKLSSNTDIFNVMPAFVLDIDLLNDEESLQDASFSEVIASSTFAEPSEGGVSIAAFPCPQGGQALLAYSNNPPDYTLLKDRKFLVLWYKNGAFISMGPKLDCVCRGEYGVAVINMETHQGVGKARYLIRESCGIEGGTKTTKSDIN